ncbi:hypothetical protein M426DRAFT_319094 [Hypoxylon sp. CI-4A]|nr:hypothetical protein M426DRAFT_319094 [Hypoxylon sp. CI-4A]
MDEASIERAIAGVTKMSEMARRDMFEPEALRGNDNTLWETMGSSIRALSLRYVKSDLPIRYFEAEIHDTWYLFARAAQSIDADHPAQDRLVRLILWAKELGTLQRAQDGESQTAVTSQGRIWSDLPFFVPDVQQAWKTVISEPAPPSYRYNLAAGIARLASIRVCSDAFAHCGLEVMREALEIPREPLSFASHVEFQILQVWIRYAGDQLLRLSLAGSPADGRRAWALDPNGPPIGPLAQQAGINQEGFSRARFVFWKERLTALKMEPKDEIVVVSECANMIAWIWECYFGLRE